MKKLLFLFLLTLTVLFPFQILNASTALSYEMGAVNEQGDLTEDVSYKNFSAITYTDGGTIGHQNISYVKAEANSNTRTVVWSKLGDNTIIRTNVIEIAKDYEANNPGYEVVAAINADYFDFTTSQTINALVQEGTTVKHSNFYLERYFSVGFTNDSDLFITNKSNKIESDFLLTIYNENGMVIKETYLDGTNRAPRDNQTTFYYDNLNQVVLSDTYMVKANVGDNTNYGSLMVMATIDQQVNTITTEDNKIVIATKNPEIQEYLENGYSLRVQKLMTGVYEGIDNIVGVGSQPLEDNLIKEFADINDQNIDFAKARHPRSSFGFTESGELYFVTFDGRQTDMNGVNLREMSYVMQQLGCDNAFNLDGGGSTQLAIKENDGFRMLNSPSDNPYRNVSDAILIVKPIIDVNGDIEVTSATSFDFSYSVNTELTNETVSVYLNDTLIETENNQVSFSDLETPSVYNISIVVEGSKNGNDYTSVVYNERVKLLEEGPDEPADEIVIPNNFLVSMEKNDSVKGFTVKVKFDDPDERFVKMYIVYDETNIICSKTSEGYEAVISSAVEDKTYSLKLEVHYINEKFQVVSKLSDSTYFYQYSNTIEVPEEPETPDEDNLNEIYIYGGIAVLLGVGFVILKSRKKGI